MINFNYEVTKRDGTKVIVSAVSEQAAERQENAIEGKTTLRLNIPLLIQPLNTEKTAFSR